MGERLAQIMADDLDGEIGTARGIFQERDTPFVDLEHHQPPRQLPSREQPSEQADGESHRVVVAEQRDAAAFQRAGAIEQGGAPHRRLGRAGRLVERDVGLRRGRKMRLHGKHDLFEFGRQPRLRRHRHVDGQGSVEAERLAHPLLALLGEGKSVLAHQDAALFQLAADGGGNRNRQPRLARGIGEPSGFVAVHRAQQRLDPGDAFAQ